MNELAGDIHERHDCIGCEYMQVGEHHTLYCHNPTVNHDVVTGEDLSFPMSCRHARAFGGPCGHGGREWKRKCSSG